MKSFWNHQIPLPPLDDQKRIAHLLGKVEGLIARRKQHLQQLDDLLKSVFLEMFGDPVRNEKGWDVQPCGKAVLDISSGTSYGGEDRAFVSLDEVGVLKISAVTKGIFDPTEFKVVNPAQIKKALRFVKRGDFLFSRANTVELVAACCVVPQDFPQLFLPDKLWVLTLNHGMVNPQFFNYLLKNSRYRDVVRSLASGGHDSMLNISMKKFMMLSIPCPLIYLQNQFAAIVEKVETLKSRYQQSLTDLETLYGALSQKAFKGELDLSRVVLPVEGTTADAQPAETHRKPKPLSRGFARQLLAAEILHRHNSHGMTQMKLQKLIHLAEYHARLDEIQGEYQRQAAGPFDNTMMYGIAAGLKKQQWFAKRGHGQNATYAPLLKAGAHEKYLPYWQDKISKIDEVLQLLGPLRPDQCEIVSTLYAAWNDLLIDGEAITDDRIIEQASKAELWHKTKEAIDPDRWPKALQWMREHHLVPTGYGKHTRKLP